ncbi:MAG: hypothetical protein IJT36_01595 [Alphaproteobacteria bacterium]|nr:hypothetical protein [Alphaproteobacteria bacterium]
MVEEIFCTMIGYAKITDVSGKSKTAFLNEAEIGDVIKFTMPLRKVSYGAVNQSENVIFCENLRTGGVSILTPNKINRVIAKFTLEPTKEI